jgi:cyclin-dependent kinase 10
MISFDQKQINLPKNTRFNCIDVNDYVKLNRLGQGTYGIVYRARHSTTNEIVALKKVILEQKDGLPISSLREISLLRQLRHENIVQVHNIAVGPSLDSIFMIMEYCDHDMAFLMDNVIAKNPSEKQFTPSQVKCLFHQLLSGIQHLHKNHIVHRDLKLSNILLTRDGTLKIADFGLARKFKHNQPMTPRVVTLWYRSPELLLGTSDYETKIDMWSAGCIFAELLLSKPLLPGNTEQQQLELISSLLGKLVISINGIGSPENVWPDYHKLPLAKTLVIPTQEYSNLSDVFALYSPGAKDILLGLLVYDPKKRWSVKQTFKSFYWDEQPRMCDKLMLPSFPELRNYKSEINN